MAAGRLQLCSDGEASTFEVASNSSLFPSLITHRNEGIYSLPLDRHGDHLDEAMYRLFTKRANSVVYLVRGPGSIILGLVNDVDTDYNSDND